MFGKRRLAGVRSDNIKCLFLLNLLLCLSIQERQNQRAKTGLGPWSTAQVGRVHRYSEGRLATSSDTQIRQIFNWVYEPDDKHGNLTIGGDTQQMIEVDHEHALASFARNLRRATVLR
ncbi:hypothetical protein C8R45DRAFT_999369 [Mycena sanguinolenta]|nr:hypothetical protein C8R45DRAFT_999369 [Mycena sanguinolenta]